VLYWVLWRGLHYLVTSQPNCYQFVNKRPKAWSGIILETAAQFRVFGNTIVRWYLCNCDTQRRAVV
jgi:hypothetical protein